MSTSPRSRLLRWSAGVLLAALVAAPAHALHKPTPAAALLTRGATVSHSAGRSWGYVLGFSSTEDLANTASTGRQVFLFRLFDYDCTQGPHVGELASCPSTPSPLLQVTTGPGDPDNPSAAAKPNLIVFDADGSYSGGVGPGVGRRQIFVKNFSNGALTRVTDAADGDSLRPTIDERGRHVVFQSTAALLGGPSGVSQIFVYTISTATLERLTQGAGHSTAAMPTKLGRIVAFESTAALLGDGHDTGVSQIFWYDLQLGLLHRLTNGNGPSRHPYAINRVRSVLKKMLTGRGAAIAFDSNATNLPGAVGGGGTQVYLASTGAGDLPPVLQLTPTAVPSCTPPSPGDCSYPAFDAVGRRLAFACTGDLLCNATSGSRAFLLEAKRLPITLWQMTGQGDVAGPLAASLGHWFVSMSTTADVTGQGVCGHQLQMVDFFDGHWQPAILAGEIPVEPTPGNPDANCDDGDPCTIDACVAAACQHTPTPCP